MRPMAMPMLAADPERFRGFEASTHSRVLIADLSDDQRQAAEKNGAKVYEDVQFYPAVGASNPLEFAEHAYWERAVINPSILAGLSPAAASWRTKTLADVMEHINAPKAWARKARGKGVTIGIVDTGISSAMKEFPSSRRSPFSKSFAYAAGPWTDSVGHGSMCAAAAAASTVDGGKHNGVAPEATILSARSNLLSTDIYKLYDWVLDRKHSGELTGPVVMSNSYGIYTCSAPAGLPQDHPYRQIILDAVAAGIVVVFAAGNNHGAGLCGNDPTKCSPNTIWGVNSMDEVLSVGTVNWDNRMDSGEHSNSSRGPGQWASKHKKPDCVAPTYGEIVWGSGYQVMEWWGTSGACPQVAGLAALLMGMDPSLTPGDVAGVIRATCRDIGLAKSCAGAGLIDCEQAMNRVIPSVTGSRSGAGTAKKKARMTAKKNVRRRQRK